MFATWPCPGADGARVPEYALTIDRGRSQRLLIVPALFDEANRLRRFTVEAMRALHRRGIDSFLPDLPGTNESLQPLAGQSLVGWRAAMAAAAIHFGATRVLTLRGGALLAPAGLPGWHYAPVSGAAVLRQMIRVRLLAAREAGRQESQTALLAAGLSAGLTLGGYPLSAAMVSQLQDAEPGQLQLISQSDIGGAGLWLRAEPGEDTAQSEALALIVAGVLA
ncbi:MAG TPA: hypothetical protein VI199_05490 [Novosphingobium sp.]